MLILLNEVNRQILIFKKSKKTKKVERIKNYLKLQKSRKNLKYKQREVKHMPNPFRPAFGAVPLYPAGRDAVLRDFDYAYENYRGNPMLTSLLIGPRGTGKTALLNMVADEARKQGWLCIDTSARSGMLEEIYQNLLMQASDFLEKKSGKLSSIQIGSFGISIENESDIQLNWKNRMEIILNQLAEQNIGLLILVDEVIAEESEMIELTAVYQLLKRKFDKLSLIMAGFPSNISSLLNEKSVTFLRRAHRIYLGRISDSDIAISFRKTIESEGKKITDEALKLTVDAIEGFAYMMQLVGYYTWMNSDSQVIDLSDAEEGIRYANSDFRTGVLESTYRELSDNDRKFLFAMLEDPKESVLKDIAARLNKSPGYVSTYKRRLLSDGIIEENPGKSFSIVIPSFREYLKEMKQSES